MNQQQFDDARDQGRWMDILKEAFVYDPVSQKPILRISLATLAATFGSAARGVNFDATVAGLLNLVAAGTDTNIDIKLTGKGNGGAILDLAQPLNYGRVYHPLLMAQGWVGKIKDITVSNNELVNLPSGLFYSLAGGSSLQLVNPIKGTVLGTVAVGSGAAGGCYVPTVDRVYATCGTSGTVEVVNPNTNAHTGSTIALAAGISKAIWCPSVNRVYVTNVSSGDVKVINPATNTVTATIAGLASPQKLCYCPSNDRIYVSTTAGLAVINPQTNTLVTTIATPTAAGGVAYCPRNDRIYVANTGSANVSAIDPSTNTIVATITVGTNPNPVCYSPAHGYLYVGNFGAGTVSIISPSSNTVLQTVTVNTNPLGMFYHAQDGLVYVGNNGSGNVSVLG